MGSQPQEFYHWLLLSESSLTSPVLSTVSFFSMYLHPLVQVHSAVVPVLSSGFVSRLWRVDGKLHKKFMTSFEKFM